MSNLLKLRNQIDKIDEKISQYLSEREEIIKKIANHKKNNKKQIKNPEREQLILEKQETQFKKQVFKSILKESKKLQEALTKK